MKKFIIFLMTILSINIFPLVDVSASSYKFYEGDYIQGIWMTKEKGKAKYWQKARFFMLNDGSNKFAYCIEPFSMFNESGSYTRSLTADNLNAEQIKRISLIAYFGYTYNNHTDPKWYAISQFMIWQIAEPTADFYFTDSLNGNRITAYTNEMDEINSLINNYLTIPSINNANVNMVEEKTITLTDTNNVLSNYTSLDSHAKIEGNKLIISGLAEGEHTINLVRSMKRNASVPFYYNSADSQNMMMIGDIDDVNISLKVNVDKTKVEVTKIDSDTKDTTPSGDASLSGAVYQIYDSNMKEVEKLIIDEDMKASIENLDYGKYYIKEITAGIGYNLDENIYEFEITHDNKDVFLKLENEVIKKEIVLHKAYGDGFDSDNEANITFEIYDSKNKLVKTITTDNNGYAKVILPFGKYTFKQKNTTDGYKYTDDFTIDVKDSNKKEINLYDYKIKVPNTKKDTPLFITVILLIAGGLVVKKNIFS